MKKLNKIQYLFIFSLILFFSYIGWSAYSKDKNEWVTFPIYKGYESCLFKFLESSMKDGDFSIEPFFLTPDSMPEIYGYVRMRRVGMSSPRISGAFHRCYPKDFSIFKISAQRDLSIINSLGLLLSDVPQDTKKMHIEINLETNELKAAFK